eukprot:1145585-Pelagomonas_calceolata.AAC.1
MGLPVSAYALQMCTTPYLCPNRVARASQDQMPIITMQIASIQNLTTFTQQSQAKMAYAFHSPHPP